MFYTKFDQAGSTAGEFGNHECGAEFADPRRLRRIKIKSTSFICSSTHQLINE